MESHILRKKEFGCTPSDGDKEEDGTNSRALPGGTCGVSG